MMLKDFSLQGRTALVTGASRGIGRAIAVALAECGAAVAVNCASRVEQANEVVELIRQRGGLAAAVPADLGQPGAPRELYQQSVNALGPIDILVLNASVQIPVAWREITPEQFEQQVAVNLRSALELMQLAAPAMIQRQWGRILSIGSVQEARPHPDMVVYAATKSAQTSMIRNLAKQLAPHHITVNNLAPGVIDTDRNRDRLTGNEPYRTKVLSAIPAGFFGQPEDCAGAAVLLCSEAGRYITGANLFVDGGMSL